MSSNQQSWALRASPPPPPFPSPSLSTSSSPSPCHSPSLLLPLSLSLSLFLADSSTGRTCSYMFPDARRSPSPPLAGPLATPFLPKGRVVAPVRGQAACVCSSQVYHDPEEGVSARMFTQGTVAYGGWPLGRLCVADIEGLLFESAKGALVSPISLYPHAMPLSDIFLHYYQQIGFYRLHTPGPLRADNVQNARIQRDTPPYPYWTFSITPALLFSERFEPKARPTLSTPLHLQLCSLPLPLTPPLHPVSLCLILSFSLSLSLCMCGYPGCGWPRAPIADCALCQFCFLPAACVCLTGLSFTPFCLWVACC